MPIPCHVLCARQRNNVDISLVSLHSAVAQPTSELLSAGATSAYEDGVKSRDWRLSAWPPPKA